jgi:hypothetical protein
LIAARSFAFLTNKLCKVALGARIGNGSFVRIADIDVHCSEGPLCSLSFESERYGPHAYHGDDIAF